MGELEQKAKTMVVVIGQGGWLGETEGKMRKVRLGLEQEGGEWQKCKLARTDKLDTATTQSSNNNLAFQYPTKSSINIEYHYKRGQCEASRQAQRVLHELALSTSTYS